MTFRCYSQFKTFYYTSKFDKNFYFRASLYDDNKKKGQINARNFRNKKFKMTLNTNKNRKIIFFFQKHYL